MFKEKERQRPQRRHDEETDSVIQGGSSSIFIRVVVVLPFPVMSYRRQAVSFMPTFVPVGSLVGSPFSFQVLVAPHCFQGATTARKLKHTRQQQCCLPLLSLNSRLLHFVNFLLFLRIIPTTDRDEGATRTNNCCFSLIFRVDYFDFL